MKIIITFISLCSMLFVLNSCADSWPHFNSPDPALIMDSIKTEGCPNGYGRMPADTSFRIPNSMPRTQIWAWQYEGESICQKLPTDPTELKYIHYLQSNYKSNGTIKLSYGLKDGTDLFDFIFKIPPCAEEFGPDCEWFCGPNDASELPTDFACALDESKLKK